VGTYRPRAISLLVESELVRTRFGRVPNAGSRSITTAGRRNLAWRGTVRSFLTLHRWIHNQEAELYGCGAGELEGLARRGLQRGHGND